MRRFANLLAFCGLSALVCTAASAATTTYNINFAGFGVQPYTGSYTLTFDPTQVYLVDTTAGLTVNALSFTTGPSGFQYVPTVAGGILTLGGLLNGVRGNGIGTADYSLQIGSFLINPMFQGLSVNTVGGNRAIVDDTGTVTVAQVATTPEPSSLALLGTGVLGLFGIARKRWLR